MQTASVLAFDQLAQHLVVLRSHPGPARGAEGHQGGPCECSSAGGAGEELRVLGVGPRPTAFDEGDPEMVELLGYPQLVVDGEREALLLGPVPQGGVEHVDGLGQHREVEVVATLVAVSPRPHHPGGAC